MTRTTPYVPHFVARRPLPGRGAADSLVLSVPAAALQRLCDPFSGAAWGIGRFGAGDVLRAVPVAQPYEPAQGRWARSRHLGRVRWLLAHGWDHPIEIDVGAPELGCTVAWPVVDGNHRFAAALLAGDAEIAVAASGSLRYLRELFGAQALESSWPVNASAPEAGSPRPPRRRGRQQPESAVSR